jgi:hypothetical protein
MTEDIFSTAVRLIWSSFGPLAGLAAVLILAVVLVLLKRAGRLKWPSPPPVSPDLVETPPSPPIVLRPDGTIPVANPLVPPDPEP